MRYRPLRHTKNRLWLRRVLHVRAMQRHAEQHNAVFRMPMSFGSISRYRTMRELRRMRDAVNVRRRRPTELMMVRIA